MMMNTRHFLVLRNLQVGCRTAALSTTTTTSDPIGQYDYDILILGGGTAGSTMASRFSCNKKLKVGVVEPSEVHYYQAMFTLVGRGLKKFEQTSRMTVDVLPKECDWIKTKVVQIDPDVNTIKTEDGQNLKYKYLIVALGIKLNYEKIEGLVEALKDDPRVCSNYSADYVRKTYAAAQNFTQGNAIFTFPETPIKCPGAPQKAMFLAEDYFTCVGKRDKATVMYNTSINKLFGIPKYAVTLQKQIDERNIQLNLKNRLVKVDYKKSIAYFETDDGLKEYSYEMLHVSPPCTPPEAIKLLADESGYVACDNKTLQHPKYPNVFSLGDCANLATSKTTAAISSQSAVLCRNLKAVMENRPMTQEYDGYTSCPLVVTKNKCILAEFGYEGKIMETFPYDQAQPRYTSYLAKAHFMPALYWMGLVKGLWNGPKLVRRIFHLGFCK